MKVEAQRIAIAKACGWEEIFIEDHGSTGVIMRGCTRIDGVLCDESEEIPDYLNDLNAIHAAALTLTDKERDEYCSTLVDVANADVDFKTVEATAGQRCEAFLKVKGLWVA